MTLIVILGPTGVGKTDLCLEVAKHFKCDIINCDSRQLFREIPIGTAAPTAQQQQQVRHFFVGTHSITDYCSASTYEADVMRLLSNPSALSNPDVAILSGGSMMYIDAVCNGIDDIPTVDESLRQELKERLAAEGLKSLLAELEVLDPEYYAIVDKQNPRRILHALEICKMSGRTYTSFRTGRKRERPFRVIKVGLMRPREELYERINQRVLNMMDEGLLEEVHSVEKWRNENALNTVGYKELLQYLDGTVTLEEAVRQIQSNTRRYMRKQETWFKRDKEIRWFRPSEFKEIIKYIQESLPLR